MDAATQPAPAKRSTSARLLASFETAAFKYLRDRCPQFAAAVSYHVLFSFVPLVLFVASVLGLVLRDDDLRAQLVDEILARVPLTEEAAADLDRILSNVPAPTSAIGIAGLLALLWSASGMMGALRVALTEAFEEGEDRPLVQSKLVDLALVIGVGALLLVSFGFSLVARAIQRWGARLSDELGRALSDQWELVSDLGATVLAFVAFLLLYHFVPPSRPRFRDVWIGALVATIGFTAVNLGFSYYLTTVATWGLIYGSLGSVLAFLFVVYLQAGVFLFGGELSAAWAREAYVPEQGETPRQPLGRRVQELVRGLFTRR